MGRYVFTPEIFESIDRTKPGAGGEIQLTDAIGGLLPDHDVYGYTFDEGRYDIGSKLDYLRATVELALAREDLGPEFREWLSAYVRDQGIGDFVVRLGVGAPGGHPSRAGAPAEPLPPHPPPKPSPSVGSARDPARGRAGARALAGGAAGATADVDGGGGGVRAGRDGDLAGGRAPVRQHCDGRVRRACRRPRRCLARLAGGAAGGGGGGGGAPGRSGARPRRGDADLHRARRSPTAPTPW